MSYIVPGEIPKTCGMCPFVRWSQINFGKCWCVFDSTNTRSYAAVFERLDNCPLIEIPTPHGRLGDLDKLKAKFRHSEKDDEVDKAWNSTVRRIITQAETIIEAEGSET